MFSMVCESNCVMFVRGEQMINGRLGPQTSICFRRFRFQRQEQRHPNLHGLRPELNPS